MRTGMQDRWEYLTTRRGGGLVVRSGRSTKLVSYFELGARVTSAQYPSVPVR